MQHEIVRLKNKTTRIHLAKFRGKGKRQQIFHFSKWMPKMIIKLRDKQKNPFISKYPQMRKYLVKGLSIMCPWILWMYFIHHIKFRLQRTKMNQTRLQTKLNCTTKNPKPFNKFTIELFGLKQFISRNCLLLAGSATKANLITMRDTQSQTLSQAVTIQNPKAIRLISIIFILGSKNWTLI